MRVRVVPLVRTGAEQQEQRVVGSNKRPEHHARRLLVPSAGAVLGSAVRVPQMRPLPGWPCAWALGFAGYRAVLIDLTKVVGVGIRLWAPPVAGHEARLEDVQPVEELGELIRVAQVV